MALAFVPDGRTLITAGEDGTIKKWSAATGRETGTVPRHPNDPPCGLAVSPDRKTLAVTSVLGLLQLFDLATNKAGPVWMKPVPGYGIGVTYSPDGKFLASRRNTNEIQLLETATGQLRLLDAKDGRVLGLAFAPDSKTLAAGTDKKTVQLWDVATGKLRGTLTGHQPTPAPWDGFRNWPWALRSMSYSLDNKTLATASNDGSVKVWNLATGRERYTVQQNDPVLAVAYRPDGRFLVTATSTGDVRLLAAETGQTLGSFPSMDKEEGPGIPVREVAFSPDGNLLAVGRGVRVELWDVGQIFPLARRSVEQTRRAK
jgi:WD40 repeat protein